MIASKRTKYLPFDPNHMNLGAEYISTKIICINLLV